MTNAILSLNESSVIATSFEYSEARDGMPLQTASEPCEVFLFEDYVAADAVPDRHVAIDDLVATWDSDPARRAAMEDARRWVADKFHAEDGTTLRTLRLRKGLSQQQLAEAVGTSQPYIARTETGTNNLTIDTCRRLADVLGVDLNSLDQALQHEELVSARKNVK